MHVLSAIVLIAWVLAFCSTVINLALIPRLPVTGRAGNEPLVSVIIPARDEERVIERTVRALLAQTYPKLELIVINDRSADATAAILRSIQDPRLIVIDGV